MSTATFDAGEVVQARVGPEWIAAHLDDDSVRVVEVDVSRAAFDAGHIPGAALWNAYGDLRPVSYRPLDAAAFARVLSRSGIGPETTVVFYGYAAYLGYWLMRSFGHPSVHLMDGCRGRWAEAGYGWAETASEHVDVRSYAPPRVRGDLVMSEDVLALIGDPDTVLVDVRSGEEFRGERFWPSGATEDAGRTGHLPGAVWLPADLIAGDAGPEDVREACRAAGVVPERHVVVYCTIGNRASLVWFVLKELLGYPRVSLYYGSWAEWGTMSDTPVET